MSADTPLPPARQPHFEAPARSLPLSALATLPVFFKLRDKKVVLIGSSDPVAWKTELLLATGAQVHLFAPNPCEGLVALRDKPNLIFNQRPWQPSDCDGAVLVIAACENEREAETCVRAAHKAGAIVNIIDAPDYCDVQFGAIVERSPLVIGISTDGAAPVFGQRIRARIETLLPDGFRAWAQAARAWRPFVQEQALDFRARRSLWERFTDAAFARPHEKPSDDELRALLHAGTTLPQSGRVALVGAGPGDPELLTLRAVRALQSADVILYDDLVSPQILAFGRREAQRVAVGKRGYKPSCTQEDITALLIELAQKGKYVVRLKGGDPMIFGRAGEEIAALKAHNISVDVIAGVTAASAAAAFMQTSLTERMMSRRLQFVTAHAHNGSLPDDLNWPALADPHATTIVYMGVRTLPLLVEKLRAHGLPDDTPAVLVERASWPEQRAFVSTLAALPQELASIAPQGPCLLMIGRVMATHGATYGATHAQAHATSA
jgi:uroporphyrin-III C-methyltransferase / precorrin-2 dehydrogenase / sirohydrochlorin ferrochelatase